MLRGLLLLLVGESLLLYGLYLAWFPLSLIVAGGQIVGLGLAFDAPEKAGVDA